MKYFHFFIFLFFVVSNLFAQEEIGIIQFKGLKHTKRNILLQKITCKKGEVINTEKAKADVQTLLNLRIFSTVSYTMKSDTLVFDCQEKLTLFPVLSFGTVGTTSFYKAGVYDANFLGRLGRLSAYFLWYDRPSFYLQTEIPYLWNSSFGVRVDAKKVATVESVFFGNEPLAYNYDNNYFGADVFKEFGLQHRLYLGGAFYNETFHKKDTISTVNDIPVEDIMFREGNNFTVKSTYMVGVINFKGTTVEGIANKISGRITFTPNFTPFAQIYNILTYFKSNQLNGNYAVRLKTGIASNNGGAFSPFVLDSYLNLRGVGNKIDRGTAQVVTNMEYRQLFYSKKWIELQGIAFLDAGVWRHANNKLDDFLVKSNQKAFVGGGLRVFIPQVYNLIFRFDYGVNISNTNQRGIVVGLGQYF